MEDWTILLISLSALCGLILLTSVIVTARVSYRRARRTKRGKLVYGSAGRREDLDGGQDDDDDATAAAAAVAGGPEAKGWFAAQPGPNGSACVGVDFRLKRLLKAASADSGAEGQTGNTSTGGSLWTLPRLKQVK